VYVAQLGTWIFACALYSSRAAPTVIDFGVSAVHVPFSIFACSDDQLRSASRLRGSASADVNRLDIESQRASDFSLLSTGRLAQVLRSSRLAAG
jgi:hypothetical protein